MSFNSNVTFNTGIHPFQSANSQTLFCSFINNNVFNLCNNSEVGIMLSQEWHVQGHPASPRWSQDLIPGVWHQNACSHLLSSADKCLVGTSRCQVWCQVEPWQEKMLYFCEFIIFFIYLKLDFILILSDTS